MGISAQPDDPLAPPTRPQAPLRRPLVAALAPPRAPLGA